MMFLADECFDARVVAGLRHDGHDVAGLIRGADDLAVLKAAEEGQRILLTEVKDFGELVVRMGLFVPGIVLVRMEPATSIEKLERVRQLIAAHSHRLPGGFTVIDRTKVRFRGLA